ncbi:response regulator transcription factor [Haloferula sp.]|uniref:response regulator transcription factor n=1 Tax=Haloferula sp. TaxID=2497595 RepID=UPI003C712FDA
MSAPLPIAFVEDDPSFSRAVTRFLSVSGHEVRTFSSAEEFLGSPPASYGCLILDYQLPGITGLELFHQLAASAPERTAIFISAQDEGDLREKVAQIPGCAFLRKPFVVAELLEAVLAQLGQHSTGIHPSRIPNQPLP